jgi:hypothetical protein
VIRICRSAVETRVKQWSNEALYSEQGGNWKSGFGKREMPGIEIKNRTKES